MVEAEEEEEEEEEGGRVEGKEDREEEDEEDDEDEEEDEDLTWMLLLLMGFFKVLAMLVIVCLFMLLAVGAITPPRVMAVALRSLVLAGGACPVVVVMPFLDCLYASRRARREAAVVAAEAATFSLLGACMLAGLSGVECGWVGDVCDEQPHLKSSGRNDQPLAHPKKKASA